MKKYFFIILLLLSLTSLAQFKDDTKHFYSGFVISTASSEIIKQLTNKSGVASISGVLIGSGIGYLKEEVYDRRMNKGIYSKNDIFITAWGSLCGSVVIRVKFDIDQKKQEKKVKQFKNDYQ